LRHSRFGSTIRAILEPATLAADSWSPVQWSLTERWLYTVATRLAWDIASRDGSARVVSLAEPETGSPFPVRWRGRLISQDLANTALEVASIERALEGHHPAHVVEIGAGYGRSAHAILSLFPEASYTIIDIHPALDISRWYLTNLFPDRDINFVDGMNITESPRPFDLALSISSLQEMTPDIVDGYLGLLDQRARPGAVVYLKQWRRWWNPVDGVEQTIESYVLPRRWQRLFVKRCPIQTSFAETAWRLPQADQR
jgi:hypothetical protein